MPLHRPHPRRPHPGMSPSLRRSAAADLALRPRRFARPRRFSPPIARHRRASRHPSRWRRTRRLVASCCRSWGSTRFSASARWSLPPDRAHVTAPAPCRSPGGCLPRVALAPPGGPSSPAAGARRRAPLPPRTFFSRRSATSLAAPFPALPLRSYRRGTGPPRPCSAGQSVPSPAVFGHPRACPPWAFPLRGRLRVRSCVRTGRHGALRRSRPRLGPPWPRRPSHPVFPAMPRGSVRGRSVPSASRALADRVASVSARSLGHPLRSRDLAVVGAKSRGSLAPASLGLCRAVEPPEHALTGASSTPVPRRGLLSETRAGAHREVRPSPRERGSRGCHLRGSSRRPSGDPCSPARQGGYPGSHRSASRTDIPRSFTVPPGGASVSRVCPERKLLP